MSTRIPSSLKWLIDKRARLDAEIQKTQSSIDKAKKLIKELSELNKQLMAIDKALEMHEISVDVNLINPVKSQYKRINLPHGELTRSIIMCLRMHAGDKTVTKRTIVEFIKSKHLHLLVQTGESSWLLRSVTYRLKSLCKEGVVMRHHAPDSRSEGLWSLALNDDSNNAYRLT